MKQPKPPTSLIELRERPESVMPKAARRAELPASRQAEASRVGVRHGYRLPDHRLRVVGAGKIRHPQA